jgi:hypothetical protein
MSTRPTKAGKRAAFGPKGAKDIPPPAPNSYLYAQTRKILSKHYRTKYGMRQGRGGRKS